MAINARRFSSRRLSPARAALVAICCAAAALLAAPQALCAPPSQSTLIRALRTLPPGWKLADGPALYSADNLHEWIDGEAVLVQEYDFLFAGQAIAAKGNLRVEIGAFVMKSALDAFGLFSRQRAPQSLGVSIPNSAFWEGGQLHIWRDCVYLRLMPLGRSGTQVRQAVRELAEGPLSVLQPAAKLPLLLRLPQPANLVPNSMVYYRRNALGHRGLNRALRCLYRIGGQKLELWIFDCGNKDGARKTLQLLARILGKTRSVAALGDEAFAGFNSTYKSTMAMREGRFCAAVLHGAPPDFAQALLRMISVRIRMFEAAGER